MGTCLPKSLTLSGGIVEGIRGVQIGPGATQLTRMPLSARSCANPAVKFRIAPFVVAYASSCGLGGGGDRSIGAATHPVGAHLRPPRGCLTRAFADCAGAPTGSTGGMKLRSLDLVFLGLSLSSSWGKWSSDHLSRAATRSGRAGTSSAVP